jgi:hypothetical protein
LGVEQYFKERTVALLVSSMEVGLEVNAEKVKMFGVSSADRKAIY